ncbi:hypothetical protein ALC57_16192 [Trachymyrmex cornetzi]|uniref:Uncharacterized protein n=1 Tax=Trachymyrmex cornetzi TaxID=471704 RepID=A0A195DGL5_9HYME|nr:hypothetical protein ALC57_16192 [Trachymyrmex cornetzi]
MSLVSLSPNGIIGITGSALKNNTVQYYNIRNELLNRKETLVNVRCQTKYEEDRKRIRLSSIRLPLLLTPNRKYLLMIASGVAIFAFRVFSELPISAPYFLLSYILLSSFSSIVVSLGTITFASEGAIARSFGNGQ